jgi:Na+/H+-dicarboxylate symporter
MLLFSLMDVYCRLTSTAASIASASVPSAALVLMLIVLSAIDAPIEERILNLECDTAIKIKLYFARMVI